MLSVEPLLELMIEEYDEVSLLSLHHSCLKRTLSAMGLPPLFSIWLMTFYNDYKLQKLGISL